jgi:hypothetical protein
LARKPRAWGKVVCLVGLPWIWFSVAAWCIGPLNGAPFYTPSLGPGLAGVALLGLGVVLLILDRGVVLIERSAES